MTNINTSPLARRDGESEYAHHRRLVYGKLKDKSLADYDYADLAPYVYGKELAGDETRKRLYGSCDTLELLDKFNIAKITDDDLLSELDAKKIELQKEKQKFFDQRTAFNKAVRDQARIEEIIELFTNAIKESNDPPLNYTPPKKNVFNSDNDLLVSLNDIHYGANIESYWNTYNSDVCREMFKNYLDQIISIAETHKSENCIVVGGGDFISGNIHYSLAVTNKENVISQLKGVAKLICEFLAALSPHFKTVKFVSVAGNHSRLNPNKDDTRIDERLDDLIEWYAEAELQNFENIFFSQDFEKIDPTMSLINIRGKVYCSVHGDYDGSDAKVQALQTMAGVPLYAVLSAHKHHNSSDTIQGIKTKMAGSFMGTDDYCVQKRIYGKPEQMVCVCDEHGIRCTYDIEL